MKLIFVIWIIFSYPFSALIGQDGFSTKQKSRFEKIYNAALKKLNSYPQFTTDEGQKVPLTPKIRECVALHLAKIDSVSEQSTSNTLQYIEGDFNKYPNDDQSMRDEYLIYLFQECHKDPDWQKKQPYQGIFHTKQS